MAIPTLARMLFRGLGSSLRLRQDATSYFANMRHIDRVYEKLVQLAQHFGRVGPDGIRLEFPITHGLLADMIASARETVTRCLDELERDGFVVRDGHSYRLLISPEALDAMSEEPRGGRRVHPLVGVPVARRKSRARFQDGRLEVVWGFRLAR
jgi:hypothetical protein